MLAHDIQLMASYVALSSFVLVAVVPKDAGIWPLADVPNQHSRPRESGSPYHPNEITIAQHSRL
jgi:hypothetical protein